MKILVTGGAGFIGSFLTDELVRTGHQVRIFDSLWDQVHTNGGKPDYLNTEAEFIQGDVRDYTSFKKAIEGCEIVFHFAAAVGVGQSQYQIKHYTDVNVGGTANLLDIIVNHKAIRDNIKKIVIAASMSSYGEGSYLCESCGRVRPPLRTEHQMQEGIWELYCPECKKSVNPVPTDENSRQNCNSIYAINKKVQEDMVLTIGKTYNIPAVALRFFNAYGPRQSLSNPYTGVMAIFMSRLKNDNAPVIFEDGKQTRDFVSVHDIVQANILAMENSSADYQSFNVGTGEPVEIKDISLILAEMCGKEIKPEILGKFRKGDVRHCYADNTKIKDVLGFKVKVPLRTGIEELLEWAEHAESVDNVDSAIDELRQKGLV